MATFFTVLLIAAAGFSLLAMLGGSSKGARAGLLCFFGALASVFILQLVPLA
jgi:hypothetical protein